MKKLLIIVLVLKNFVAFSQEKITFPSLDGLPITADYYKALKSRPCILFFHQAGYGRGEYLQTAKHLQQLGYICIAIDQRSGNAVNGVANETAVAAKNRKLPTSYLDAEQDMEAAIEYCFNRFQKKIIIVGSSYSASLALKLASTNTHVLKVISFSPGEYFNGKLLVAEYVASIKIPTWVTSSKSESKEVTDLLKNAKPKFVKQFIPEQAGEHGSKVLWLGDEKTNEYWKAMLAFIKQP